MPKRYGKHTANQLKIKNHLTPNDLQELDKYKGFLNDLSKLSKPDLMKKHGEYMGFSESERAEYHKKHNIV